jgi:transcriptional regulator with XRE-family HTH domain
MTVRQRPIDIGIARARNLRATAIREIHQTRLSAGLSQEIASDAAGISRARYGRIERGVDTEVSIEELARIGAALGLELSVRFFPSGDPVRDAGHRAVLERLRRSCHPMLTFRTEVPLPGAGDPRAWDAVIGGFRPRCVCGVEAETRPSDEQALHRKLAGRRRDGGVDRLLLVLPDTRHNRAFVRSLSRPFLAEFRIRGSRALELLRAGVDPGGDSILLL